MMRAQGTLRIALVAGTCLVAGVGIGVYASASGPAASGIAYSGVLNNNGAPANGPHDFRFDLIDATATAQCPTDVRDGLMVTGGRFDVANLFASCGNLGNLLAGQTSVSIRITVEGNQLLPDQPIGAVPVALHAKYAESAGTAALVPDSIDATLLASDSASLAKVSGGLLAAEGGALRLAPSATACTSAAHAGLLRWTGTALELCTGASGWRAIMAAGTAHRFWRTLKTDSAQTGGYHTELEVYNGATRVNVSAGMLSHFGLQVGTLALLVDGNTGNYPFHTDSAGPGTWMMVDFGAGNPQALTGWRYYVSHPGVYATWTIQWSDDGSSWTTAAAGLNVAGVAGWRTITW